MTKQAERFDVVVLGAGGAGMMCAATAARRGRRTVALDHGDRLGRKILISGGGRCNFTNTGAGPANYYSSNPHFAKSALARFTPRDFLALVEKHGLPYYEKKLGQQFCVDSAQRIVDLLKSECDEAGADIRLQTKIESIDKIEAGEAEDGEARFRVRTSAGEITARSLVMATGGLSVPKVGATDFGYKVARQFGLSLTNLDAALVSLTMPPEFQAVFGELSGVSVDVEASVGKLKFRENLLFTHTGVSGPVILQVSLQWFPGDPFYVNLSPDTNMERLLLDRKKEGSRKEIKTLLAERFTERLGAKLAEAFQVPAGPVAQVADAKLKELAAKLHRWELVPAHNGGYGKAEVTRGGVDTNELSSKTLECKKVPGLYFIGELVDVTGWLGGYNFQWAWASGHAAGSEA